MAKKNKTKNNKNLSSLCTFDAVPINLNGVIDRKNPPDYINIDGHQYERLEIDTTPIELDLDPAIVKLLVKKMKSGGYVNHQEIIRESLRELIKSL